MNIALPRIFEKSKMKKKTYTSIKHAAAIIYEMQYIANQ